MEYLISKSADVNVSNARDKWKFKCDLAYVMLFLFVLLQVKDKHGITPMLAAIWEGHTECVEVLLRGGADIKGTAPDGTSYVDAAEKDEIKKLIS